MRSVIFFDLGDTLVDARYEGDPPQLRFHPLDGAADLLARLRNAGFTLGIISNTGEETGASVNRALADIGLGDLFEIALRLFSGDLPHLRPKPHPDLFNEARRRSGDGARIIFVGENAAEREAARATGLESLDISEVEAVLLVSAGSALLDAMPEALKRQLDIEIVDETGFTGLVPYPPLPGEHFETRHVTGRILAYASPDSTYAVTGPLLDSATTSIVIGLYDFRADYMKNHLKRALRRGVSVTMMLDSNRADDPSLFSELRDLGATCVTAPSSSAKHPTPCFDNAHEKIIVVDGQIVMIQSGNWSENSIPFNQGDGIIVGEFNPGNRDMGLAVESPDLAALFAELVLRDIRLAQGLPPDDFAPSGATFEAVPSALFFEQAPTQIPEPLFSSLKVTPSAPVPITPVVTPENFHSVARTLLRSSSRSLRLEQQYIRGWQPAIGSMLEDIAAARADNPELTVQIIISPKYLYGEDRRRFLQAMEDFGFAFGENFRFLSLDHFVHCHNKLIIVDDERTLLGSQNWSTTGVLSNREAALLVDQADIARYFARIFDADWEMSEGYSPTEAQLAGLFGDPSSFAQRPAVISSARDYAAT